MCNSKEMRRWDKDKLKDIGHWGADSAGSGRAAAPSRSGQGRSSVKQNVQSNHSKNLNLRWFTDKILPKIITDKFLPEIIKDEFTNKIIKNKFTCEIITNALPVMKSLRYMGTFCRSCTTVMSSCCPCRGESRDPEGDTTALSQEKDQYIQLSTLLGSFTKALPA